MKFELDEYHRKLSDEELIADLKRVAIKLGKDSVTRDEYKEQGKYSSRPFENRFGSWLKSLQAAGLKKNVDKNITEEELFSNLEEVWIKLGKQPRYSNIKKLLSKYSTSPYEQRFGTWRKALEKFVEYINSEKQISFDEKIENPIEKPFEKHKKPRSVNLRLRFIVMRRDKFKCKNCGQSPATDPSVVLHVDHIKAWAKNGKTELENLQTLCSKCNFGKSDLE
jgi:hypothetical protein